MVLLLQFIAAIAHPLSPAHSCSLSLAPSPSPVSTLSSQLSEVFWSHYHSQTFTPDNLSGREPVLCTVQGTLVMIRGVGACLQWKYLFFSKLEGMGVSFSPYAIKHLAVSIRSLQSRETASYCMRTIVGQPSEDTELISQTEQWDSDALLQTTNPFPETLHNAQWTCIRQSCTTMHNTNGHLPRLWPIVITR